MKKLSVPYTIKRRGIYYLNLRWENTFIRKSLATGNPLEAINLINQIRPHLKESMATYSYKVAELDHLQAIAHSVGIMEGPKRSGRKPKIKLKK